MTERPRPRRREEAGWASFHDGLAHSAEGGRAETLTRPAGFGADAGAPVIR